jgi:hypothetical protein
MAKKKKTAKKKAAKKRSRPRTEHVSSTLATGGEGQAADLAELVRENDVDPGGTTEVVVSTRVLSDAQSGNGTPPAAPTPAPVDSTAEVNVATAAEAMAAEVERWRERTKAVIRTGRAEAIRGRQDSLWALEPKHLKKPPRLSFFGRAIRERTADTTATTVARAIFNKINEQNPQLLSAAILSALQVSVMATEGAGASRRRAQTDASATIAKEAKKRADLLQNKLGYAEVLGRSGDYSFRLTRLGRQVFNEWPRWREPDAIPDDGDEPAPEEPTGGPATEPT